MVFVGQTMIALKFTNDVVTVAIRNKGVSQSQAVAQIAGKIRNEKLSRSKRKEDESDVVQGRKEG